MPEVSVVVVSTSPVEEIQPISALEAAEFDDYETIVRDDEGVAKARNEGIKRARGEKIVFLDDDAQPLEGYLAAAADVLDQQNVVAGRVVHPRDGVIARMPTHYPTNDEGRYVDNVVGCNMGFRKEVFDTIGYFDERFSWGHEEREFVERAKSEYPVYYEPEMAVIHTYADSILEYWHKQYLLGDADVHRARKNEKSDRAIAMEVLNPVWYIIGDPVTLPLYIVANVCRAGNRIKTLLLDHS